MTIKQHHKWDSRDIANHTKQARYADLRSGELYQGDEPGLPHGAGFVYGVIFAAVFWAVAGVAVWVLA